LFNIIFFIIINEIFKLKYMLDRTKTNNELGNKIHNYLLEKGVETPMIQENVEIDNEEKISKIQFHFTEIMNTLGLDLSDDSLQQTPTRVAKMYVKEIFWGLDYNNFPKITTIENKMQYDEFVVVKDIKVNSECEHHFQKIWGKVSIGYLPNKKVIGLSKINRVVEFFCKRPAVQERITEQIYYTLSYILDTPDVAVVMDAEHFCVKSRGVEDENSHTYTSKLGGIFIEPNSKNELFQIINNKR